MSTFLSTESSPSKTVLSLPLDELRVTDAVPIDGGSKDESATYRNAMSPDQLVDCVHPQLSTHAAMFNNAVEMYGDRPCFGFRRYNYSTNTSSDKYSSFSYAEVNSMKKRLGSGILSILRSNPFKKHPKIDSHTAQYPNFSPTNTSFILSIFSTNRYEWLLTDLACSAYSITNTALYDTLGPSVVSHVLESTESPIVVCSGDKIRSIIDLKREYPDQLKHLISLVSMDPISDFRAEAESLNMTLHTFDQVMRLGEESLLAELPPSPQTLYTISFTSGTTGANPKGAKISQRNITAAMTFFLLQIPQVRNGRALIFLPLTHIFERGTLAYAFSAGYYLGFPHLQFGTKQDAFTSLIEDCKIFKPHYFSIVPRILTKMESVVKSHIKEMDSVSSSVVNRIIQSKISKQSQEDGASGSSYISDHFVKYSSLRSMLGFDNLVWTQTASAPVNPATLVYLKASLNIGISQLYGLTESCGAYCRSHIYEANPGSCGGTGITCEVKVVSKPEMGYLAEKNMGELWIRGSQIFDGYFKNEEETRAAKDDEGWFHTGDISRIDPKTGRIYIIDRVKNFFKLAQGEYISPEKVENIYLSRNPIIQQLYVHGDSLRSWLVAVVGVSHEGGLKFLNEECGYNKVDMSEREMLTELNKSTNRAIFLRNINSSVKDILNGIEKLHNIHIEVNPLTVERDVVTPTFKIKRAVAARFFKLVFDRLYEMEQSLVKI